MNKIVIIIVNYQTPDLTLDCLASLEPEVAAFPQTQVYVVDNASPDDSVAVIANGICDRAWDWVTFLPHPTNGGFAAGNNLVLQRVLAAAQPPDYLWLLNPDTVVRPGSLAPLVTFLDHHPHVGLVGSRLEDADGAPQYSAFRFPSVGTEFARGLGWGLISRLFPQWTIALPIADQACPVDWVAGASLIIRRAVFEQIGLLDEGYFLYFEEVDFCRRARNQGWDCWYLPESRVVHWVGQSSGINAAPKATVERLPTYWFAARRRYFVTHYGRVYTMVTDLLWLLAYLTLRGRSLIQRKPLTDPPHLWFDFLHNSVLLPGRF